MCVLALKSFMMSTLSCNTSLYRGNGSTLNVSLDSVPSLPHEKGACPLNVWCIMTISIPLLELFIASRSRSSCHIFILTSEIGFSYSVLDDKMFSFGNFILVLSTVLHHPINFPLVGISKVCLQVYLISHYVIHLVIACFRRDEFGPRGSFSTSFRSGSHYENFLSWILIRTPLGWLICFSVNSLF